MNNRNGSWGPGRIGAVVAAVLAVLVLAGMYLAGAAMTGSSMPRDAAVAGIPIGNLTRQQAADALERGLSKKAGAALTLTAGDKKLTLAASKLGLGVDYAASAARAGGAHSWNPVVIWDTVAGGRDHEPVTTTDRATLTAAVRRLAAAYDHPPVDARLTLDKTTPRLTEGTDGGAVQVDETVAAVEKAYLTASTVPAAIATTEADITTEEAADALETIARPAMSAPVTLKAGARTAQLTPSAIAPALTFRARDGRLVPSLDPAVLDRSSRAALAPLGSKPPRDADIVIKGGKPAIVPSQDGTGIDPEDLAKVVTPLLSQTSGRTANVTIGVRKPAFSTADAAALGVKEITGEFTTRFPATAYRVNNIGKSAGLVNHTLLKPGEVFSMNRVLGPRTVARGWMAGGAIDGGRVVERMGGGISQTTTTTFNAIFFAGLEDVYHKPHSLYFSRYPLGREATLDYESVDMKFRNNTSYGVLLQGFTNNPRVGGRGTVTIRVWSTKTYDVKASEPIKSNVRAPGKPIEDDSAVCTPQSPMTGFRVDYKRLFYSGGKLVKSEPFRWTYNTLAEVTCTNPDARRDRVVR